jgi:hypothetical protein
MHREASISDAEAWAHRCNNAEAADYWRRCQSEWAARARRSLKFCEMQVNLIASVLPTGALSTVAARNDPRAEHIEDKSQDRCLMLRRVDFGLVKQ